MDRPFPLRVIHAGSDDERWSRGRATRCRLGFLADETAEHVPIRPHALLTEAQNAFLGLNRIVPLPPAHVPGESCHFPAVLHGEATGLEKNRLSPAEVRG